MDSVKGQIISVRKLILLQCVSNFLTFVNKVLHIVLWSYFNRNGVQWSKFGVFIKFYIFDVQRKISVLYHLPNQTPKRERRERRKGKKEKKTFKEIIKHGPVYKSSILFPYMGCAKYIIVLGSFKICIMVNWIRWDWGMHWVLFDD